VASAVYIADALPRAHSHGRKTPNIAITLLSTQNIEADYVPKGILADRADNSSPH
jgi:hypothetical protein